MTEQSKDPQKPETTDYKLNDSQNDEVNAQIDDFIGKNPQKHQQYTQLVTEKPERAVRSLILKDIRLGEARNVIKSQAQSRNQSYDTYRKTHNAVVDGLLSRKENQAMATRLKERYPDHASNPQQAKGLYREATITLNNTGTDVTAHVKAARAKETIEQAKKSGIKV